MQTATAHRHQVLPTTRVETAEERLALDVEELLCAVRTTGSALELRRAETHVLVDERRVRSLRALPAHRCARRESDARTALATAYDALAEAYRLNGRFDRAHWAAGRASEERGGSALAA
jgi:hypothetical protein